MPVGQLRSVLHFRNGQCTCALCDCSEGRQSLLKSRANGGRTELLFRTRCGSCGRAGAICGRVHQAVLHIRLPTTTALWRCSKPLRIHEALRSSAAEVQGHKGRQQASSRSDCGIARNTLQIKQSSDRSCLKHDMTNQIVPELPRTRPRWSRDGHEKPPAKLFSTTFILHRRPQDHQAAKPTKLGARLVGFELEESHGRAVAGLGWLSAAMEVAAPASSNKDVMLMPPPPARPPAASQVTVLDEDEWTEKIEGIIRRDFFPDVPKLENKLEWLQAVRSGDPEIVRQAQMNIAHRRAGMKTPIGATPAHLVTPGASMLWAPMRQGTPAMTPAGATPGLTPGLHRSHYQPSSSAQPQEAAVPSMSLDKFFRQHNSEDNASFSIIREGEAKRRRAEKPWLFSDKNPKQLEAPAAESSNGHALPAPHDDRPNLLISWPHTNKNALYYDSSQRTPLALTKEELDQQVVGPPRQISHSNTRIKSSEAQEQQAQESAAEPGQKGIALNSPSRQLGAFIVLLKCLLSEPLHG